MRFGTSEPSDFTIGVIAGILLVPVLIISYRVLTWIGIQVMNSPVQGIITWATTEQAITYVPADTIWHLPIIAFIVLLIAMLTVLPQYFRGGAY